ncbi:MAG: tRNA 2-thiouridine(34) synthase MnmA [Bacillota bacterium]
MGLRIVVAMSGGVDSSLACALLRERGHEVIGVTMRPWSEDPSAWDPMLDRARAAAEQLGVPHRVVDVSRQFRRQVVDDFVASYLEGRTPNPCVICNPAIKFDVLWEAVRDLDPDRMATGHYARRSRDPKGGRHLLLRGRDRGKDQSYVLWRVSQDQLSRSLFPLGELCKEQVRKMAADRGLEAKERAESQEICFLFGEEYREFIARRAGCRIAPGPILDTRGRTLGQHRGLPFYTVGQRRGLGISAPHPLYVLELDRTRNAIIAGPRRSLEVDGAVLEDANFIAISRLEGPMRVEVQVRYNARAASAQIRPGPGGGVLLRFDRPQRAVTPGQSAVCYRGDLLVGGGIIQRPQRIGSASPGHPMGGDRNGGEE